MEVEVIEEATSPEPEKAVALGARNDYYSGNITDDDFEEVMSAIEGDEIDEKLYNLLVEELLQKEHYGPFEHPQIMFHVEGMSRVTMAQITRHRHMSFDIQSMRYVDFEDADIAVPKSLTDEDHFSRETGLVWEDNEYDPSDALQIFERAVDNSVTAYNEMVKMGVPREDARYVLPLGAKVNVTFSGNLRTMLHVANMRGKADAQWEVRELTDCVCEHLDDWAPRTMNYFDEKGPFKLGM